MNILLGAEPVKLFPVPVKLVPGLNPEKPFPYVPTTGIPRSGAFNGLTINPCVLHIGSLQQDPGCSCMKHPAGRLGKSGHLFNVILY